MWSEPYLETCCRSALHRLALAGGVGRPDGLKDGRCLQRLAALGLAEVREDGRFGITPRGRAADRRFAHSRSGEGRGDDVVAGLGGDQDARPVRR